MTRPSTLPRLVSRVLSPGAWILRQLPVWSKVALVLAVLAGPLVGSVAVAVSGARADQSATLDEQQGLPVVVALDQLALALARCSDAALEGGTYAGLPRAQAKVAVALRIAGLGPIIERRWQRLNTSIGDTVPRRGTGCAEPTAVRPVMLSLLRLITLVGDDRGLSLDPRQHSHYQQRILTDYLPRTVAGLTEVQSLLISATNTLKPAQRYEIVRASVVAGDATARLDNAVDLSARMETVPGDARLKARSRSLRAWASAQATTLQRAVDTGADAADVAHLVGDPDPGLDLLDGLVRAVARQLEHDLAVRSAAQRWAWWGPTVSTVTALTVVLYLMAALGWSMSRDLRAVRAGLSAAVEGRTSSRPRVRGRDELSSVARSVGEAQSQIATLLQELRRSVDRHESYVRHSSDVTVVTDAVGRMNYVSPSLVNVLGHDPADWTGALIVDVVVDEDRAAAELALCDLADGEPAGELRARFHHADGHDVFVTARFKDARGDDAVGGVVWNLRDVTDEENLAERLRHRAFHDDLTGLANRPLFLDRLQHLLVRCGREPLSVAIGVLDLDGFKDANDRFGHRAGDELLQQVSALLTDIVRPADTAARLGGDEFGLLLVDVELAEAERIASRVAAALGSRPLVLEGGVEVRVAASIGLTIVQAGGRSADEVLHEADIAMYDAKSTGGGKAHVFDPGMSRYDPRAVRAEVEELLADPHGISIVFQPICDLRGARVVGYEALSRFPGREHRAVDEWFRVARACGCGSALEAAALAAALRVTGRPADTYLSVNVSPATILSAEVQRVLDRDLHDVVLEITEDSQLAAGVLEAALAPLRSRGARIAVDDTGAGYANLKQLVRLRPDLIKLDRELVTAVHQHPEKRALVEALVSFSGRTGAVLCAEGVEELAELVTLAELGVGVAQGWFLARPSASFVDASAEAVRACGGAHGREGAADIAPLLALIHAAPRIEDVATALTGLRGDIGASNVTFSLVDRGALVIVNEDVWVPSDSVYLVENYPATGHALGSGDAVEIRSEDPGADPAEVRLLRELGYRSLLIVPVLNADQVAIAVIEVYSIGNRTWSDLDRAVMAQVTLAVAVTLERLDGEATDELSAEASPSAPTATVLTH